MLVVPLKLTVNGAGAVAAGVELLDSSAIDCKADAAGALAAYEPKTIAGEAAGFPSASEAGAVLPKWKTAGFCALLPIPAA